MAEATLTCCRPAPDEPELVFPWLVVGDEVLRVMLVEWRLY